MSCALIILGQVAFVVGCMKSDTPEPNNWDRLATVGAIMGIAGAVILAIRVAL